MHDPDVSNYKKLATENLLIGQNVLVFQVFFLQNYFQVKVRVERNSPI